MSRTFCNDSFRSSGLVVVVVVAVDDSGDDCVVAPAFILKTDDLEMWLLLWYCFLSDCVVPALINLEQYDVDMARLCSMQSDLATVKIAIVSALAEVNRIIYVSINLYNPAVE